MYEEPFKLDMHICNEYLYNFARANLQSSIGLVDWNELQKLNHVNIAVDHLYDIIYEVFETFVSVSVCDRHKYIAVIFFVKTYSRLNFMSWTVV